MTRAEYDNIFEGDIVKYIGKIKEIKGKKGIVAGLPYADAVNVQVVFTKAILPKHCKACRCEALKRRYVLPWKDFIMVKSTRSEPDC